MHVQIIGRHLPFLSYVARVHLTALADSPLLDFTFLCSFAGYTPRELFANFPSMSPDHASPPLFQHPAEAAKLRAEVDSVLGDRVPTIEDMRRLRYTTRVINEAMRLYPQPPVLIRRAMAPDELGGFKIKA